MLGLEPFYMEFVAGVESVIAERGIALMLQVVGRVEAEIAVYRTWWSERRVDGVILVDLTEPPDPRVAVIQALGIPAVSVSSAASAGGLAHVWSDDRGEMIAAVRYVLRLGHRRLARVAGIATLSHVRERDQAFHEALAEAGLPPGIVVETDFSGEAGARATRALLTRDEPPTAILYDNDIMAVAGLGVANEMGVAVPAELSLLAWDDSPLCEITHPRCPPCVVTCPPSVPPWPTCSSRSSRTRPLPGDRVRSPSSPRAEALPRRLDTDRARTGAPIVPRTTLEGRQASGQRAPRAGRRPLLSTSARWSRPCRRCLTDPSHESPDGWSSPAAELGTMVPGAPPPSSEDSTWDARLASRPSRDWEPRPRRGGGMPVSYLDPTWPSTLSHAHPSGSPGDARSHPQGRCRV